jgi:hypothetical protein
MIPAATAPCHAINLSLSLTPALRAASLIGGEFAAVGADSGRSAMRGVRFCSGRLPEKPDSTQAVLSIISKAEY